MATADSIVALAQELGLERKLLYCWREQFEKGGSEGLRRASRPVGRGSPAGDRTEAAEPSADPQRRIEELERKIGQQQVELDFFRAALRQVRERRCRTEALASRRLRHDPGDDVAARRFGDHADLHAGRDQPRQLPPALACSCAT